ncbi:DNA topoisomerase, partial [Gilvimarinus sp. 1_MG-2023]
YQLITYPRSDCRYLPMDHYSRREAVIQAIGQHQPELASVVQGANLGLRSKAWNDRKVEAHHAIIPTEKNTGADRLTLTEKQLYSLIARQYLLQFYPPYRYADRRIELEIAGGRFVANERENLE